MKVRSIQSAVLAAAIALPAAALAEGIPPHSSYYDQHPKLTKPENDVSMVVHRRSGRADVYVGNFCLGSMHGYPMQAQTRSAHLNNGTLSFNGDVYVYTQTGSTTVSMKVSASVTSQKVTGTVEFPKTASCKTISFTAKLVQSRP